MTVDEILKLGAMGYTKDDIEAMSAEQKPEPEKEKEEPEKKEPEKKEPEKKEPEKKEAEKKEAEQKSEPAPDPTKDLLKFMAGEFEKLNKSIQDANIIGSNIELPKEKTAEDVLAELIAPPKHKGGK